jgi:uncharacterized protein YacL
MVFTRIGQVIGVITAVSMLVPFFLKTAPAVTRFSSAVQNMALVIAAFALGVGAISLFQLHGRRVAKRDPNSPYSLALLVTMSLMVIFGLIIGTPSSPAYKFMFDNVLNSLNSMFFAILCFYLGSAAYRAFIIKNGEAAVMMVSAVLVMIGNIPLGTAVWSQFPVIANWIMVVPNTAAMRGILLGGSLGFIATGLRILLGLERTLFGGTGNGGAA